MKNVKLSDRVEMPILGFGVYQILDLKECERVVSEAIEVGLSFYWYSTSLWKWRSSRKCY